MDITITDTNQLAGINAAYAIYVQGLAQGSKPAFATATAYFQARCEDIATSYYNDLVAVPDTIKAYVEENPAKIKAITDNM